MHTDLPVPVAPATSRCGMGARSAKKGSPELDLPSATARGDRLAWTRASPRISFRPTVTVSGLGSSMPTAPLPGTGASTRTRVAFMARAMSSERFTMELILTPGAGSRSKRVITGPGWMSVVRACTPKF
jgi:hypothetical protein